MAESSAALLDKENRQAKDVCEPVVVVAAALHHMLCHNDPMLSTLTIDSPAEKPGTLEFLPTCLRTAGLHIELKR
jgi:hypothetical protein